MQNPENDPSLDEQRAVVHRYEDAVYVVGDGAALKGPFGANWCRQIHDGHRDVLLHDDQGFYDSFDEVPDAPGLYRGRESGKIGRHGYFSRPGGYFVEVETPSATCFVRCDEAAALPRHESPSDAPRAEQIYCYHQIGLCLTGLLHHHPDDEDLKAMRQHLRTKYYRFWCANRPPAATDELVAAAVKALG